MAEGFALRAGVRERTGKGAARALRREGMIPAVIYGNNEPPVAISVPHKEMTLALYSGGFLTNVWSIEVGGKTVQALARDYQREPVKDRLMHIDFLRVTARSRVTVDVPVTFVGEDESPGLVNGGVLNVVLHALSLDCPATRIPHNIEVSVAGLEIGATITSDDVTLPPEIAFAGHHEEAFPIATIATPVAEVVEEAPEAALADEAEAEEGTEVGEGEGEDGSSGEATGER